VTTLWWDFLKMCESIYNIYRKTDSLDEQLKTSPIHLLSTPHVMYHVSLEPGHRTINSSSALRSIIAPLLNSGSAQPTTIYTHYLLFHFRFHLPRHLWVIIITMEL